MLNELFVHNVGFILDTIIVKPDYSDPYLQWPSRIVPKHFPFLEWAPVLLKGK